MQIPGFQIIREIGKGGMATVYLAVQESLDREVAIKVMSPFLAEDETFGERFVREAKIVAKLTHPYIIAVYDVGTVDGQFYFAMQYSPGGDLKQKIATGLTEQQVVIITQQIASALQYAHDKGFIHRDVKPANILFDQHGNACLTDFGVAKATRAATTNLTVAGSVIGTPTYMSPEQARGDAINHCSDLYSLGVVFYEMLSGQPPFHGDSGVSIAIKHISDPVPLLPDAYARYQNFVNKLLSKNPQDRFQSGNEIIQELNNVYQYSSDAFTQIMPTTPPQAQPTGPHSGLGQAPMSQPMSQPIVAQAGLPTTPPPMSQPGTQQELRPAPYQTTTPPPMARPGVDSAVKPTAKKGRWAIPLSLLFIVGVVAVYLVFEPNIHIGVQPLDSTSEEAKQTTSESAPQIPRQITNAIPPKEPSPETSVSTAPQEQAQAAKDRKREKIEKLLSAADQAYDNNNFIYPQNQSALSGYRKVLSLDPDNQPARDGIQRIGNHYLKYAREAAGKNNLFLAEQHLTQAQTIIPGDPQIAAVKAEIELAKQQQVEIQKQKEQQRLALAQQANRTKEAAKAAAAETTSKPVEKSKPTTKTQAPEKTVHTSPKPEVQKATKAQQPPSRKPSPPSTPPANKPATRDSSALSASSSSVRGEKPKEKQPARPTQHEQPPKPAEKSAQAAQTNQVATLQEPKNNVGAEVTESERLRQIEKQIRELTQKGRKLLSKKELTYEEINQAHKYFQEIDSLSPNHRYAKQGYTLVVNAFVRLATKEYRHRDYNDARRSVAKGLSIDRTNSKLRALDRRLKRAPAGNRSDTQKQKEPPRRSFGGF